MLIEKDYCDYDTCVALRELEYNAPQRLLIDYFGVYDEPQYDERIHLWDAQKWLREKGIDICLEVNTKNDRLSNKYYTVCISYMSRIKREYQYLNENFNSYEEALLEGIKEAVKLLKEEK